MAAFAEELGVFTEATPKGYCELAGRGIEYCWGKSKLDFRLSIVTVNYLYSSYHANPI
jgi:hypothetical protein